MGKTVRHGEIINRSTLREFRRDIERVEKSSQTGKRRDAKRNRKTLKYTYADYASLD